jgi:hypothetical protein
MYQCPENHVPADGLPIDYRIGGLDTSECLSKMRADGHVIDIALIDPFHAYEQSLRDLTEGFRLISEGGTLVVHDCLPPRAELAQPKFIPGEWCGVTYQAFIDFVNNREDLEFYTVDTNYGCGIIHKQPGRMPAESVGSRKHGAAHTRAQTLANWQTKRDDPWAAFSFFEANKRTLMNVISIDEFLVKNPNPSLRRSNHRLRFWARQVEAGVLRAGH